MAKPCWFGSDGTLLISLSVNLAPFLAVTVLGTQIFEPQGDQPEAIAALTEGVRAATPHQVLLGVTGSGKTFTMSHVVANVNKPTLVIAPNKTLAAQLYSEFRTLFPDNAVRYFVSY